MLSILKHGLILILKKVLYFVYSSEFIRIIKNKCVFIKYICIYYIAHTQGTGLEYVLVKMHVVVAGPGPRFSQNCHL